MNHLSAALDSFRCCKDKDIETFLRTKALQFLDRNWCSTYLLVDNQAFDKGKIKIDAYFTLSHKSLISQGVSKEKIKKITGGLNQAESLHFVLIGQLGKHIEKLENGKIIAADITSTEILDCAFEVIRASSNLIPCRFALVECSKNPKVQKVYQDYQFSLFQHDENYNQFYRKI